MKSRINKKPHAGCDVGPIEKRIRTCRLFSFFYPGCKRPQINPASAEVRTGGGVCQTMTTCSLSEHSLQPSQHTLHLLPAPVDVVGPLAELFEGDRGRLVE